MKKGNKPHYGHKVHIAVDTKDGFILGGQVMPAHVADISEFDRLLAKSNLTQDSLVVADKGYSGGKNRATLEERKYVDGIMHKAVRGKPLTFIQRLINRLISSVRYRVDQGIGTLKRRYGFSRMRYTGLKKETRSSSSRPSPLT